MAQITVGLVIGTIFIEILFTWVRTSATFPIGFPFSEFEKKNLFQNYFHENSNVSGIFMYFLNFIDFSITFQKKILENTKNP